MNQITEKLTHEEAVERAKGLYANLKSRFKLTEEMGRQPLETIQEFKDAGLVRALVPERWGGYELGFDTLFRTTAEVAKADPSAGWCYTLLLTHSWMLAYFPEEAQRDVWGKTPDACIASSYNWVPTNEVIPVEGGYQVTGKWGYSSGIDHSDWIQVQANLDAENVIMMLIPKEDFEIEHDWNTVAQKGSGSNTIHVKNIFVPKHRTIDMVAWAKGEKDREEV